MDRFIKVAMSISFFIYGCTDPFNSDDPQNFCVEIWNDTDRVVSIYYSVEIEDMSGDVIVNQERAEIEIGGNIRIGIAAYCWDGEFTAEYDGILRVYEVDEKFFDCREIRIKKDDF